MDLNKELKKLDNIHLEKPQKVFTMYLNTDPSDPDQQGGEWKIQLKNGLNNFENYLKEDGDSDEKRNFWNVREKVESFIEGNEQNFGKCAVVFATGDDTVWFAERFQMPVKTEFYWEESPVLDQLKEMQEKFPKTGIILTQKNQIKAIDANLGTINDSHLFELDLNTEDWRVFKGPQRGQNRGQSGGQNTQFEQYKDRFDANRYRWYKSVAPKLDKLAKDHGWQRIYMVGDKEELKDLDDNMNKEVNKYVNKNLLDHEETSVIAEVVTI
ncbi:VLRF1 family aeRF1-type release factor [Halobacillus massiliensis]|uniref:VLRF1 family aeRF1-type release factor n=1 Tax=Halobacillus massiliensis TaxID=1926286 RepID=UPI0009E21816|nr:VLRF1 family aeRF1-type release factor [Halobacillus massiliensis]